MDDSIKCSNIYQNECPMEKMERVEGIVRRKEERISRYEDTVP